MAKWEYGQLQVWNAVSGETVDLGYPRRDRQVFLIGADGESEQRDSFATQLSELHAATTDPDLAQLHRRLAAGSAQPPGDIGRRLTPAQVIDESRRIRQQVSSGDLLAAWDRRVQLGYGVPSDGIPQADRFWLDASPAIAALRFGGFKDHPILSMCCGMAEQGHDRSDPEQRAAIEELNELFLG